MNKATLYIIVLAALFLLFRRRKSGEDLSTEIDMLEELKTAFSEVIDLYGVDNARKLERLYRWETSHFRSKQFKQGFTPGMEIGTGKTTFPFGWSSLKDYAKSKNLQPDEFSTFPMREGGTGITKTFIAFPDLKNAVLFTAYVLSKRSWNPGSWYSTDPANQQRYNEKLKGVIPRIVNSLV